MKNPTTTLLTTILTLTHLPHTTTHPTLSLPTLPTPPHNHTTHTTHLTLPPTLDCFNSTTPHAHPLSPTSCSLALDTLLADPAGIMTIHTYSWHGHIAHSFSVPAEWALGQCQILLTCGFEDGVDEFRLVDVAVAARTVLDECVPISKTGLGGLALVGGGKGFFVAVNGPRPGGGAVERG